MKSSENSYKPLLESQINSLMKVYDFNSIQLLVHDSN